MDPFAKVKSAILKFLGAPVAAAAPLKPPEGAVPEFSKAELLAVAEAVKLLPIGGGRLAVLSPGAATAQACHYIAELAKRN